ncbi:helix-turn-helix transcriptional regulator [Microbaculum marinisediminis]|uniref:AlpA family phage regulatory protein n=1 Tax=Microbaculum marinisediminis TaxID=2931392 RepID=A0AAW5QS42_9HYPH|nr:AlpA family phage regulatory protein [Microbaculum sp. A6E488]MCT8970871.1 AlpA family phage regulatory protein [Microbaculum sp. A6E488]
MEAFRVSELQEFLRIADVTRATGLHRSSIYRLMTAGDFPAPVKAMGQGGSRWLASEIAAWQAGRIAARNAEKVAA